MVSLHIACLARKGGVGKSILACLLAREFAAGGGSVVICDHSAEQRTSFEWAARRADRKIEPSIQCEVSSWPPRALRPDVGLVISDGGSAYEPSQLECAHAATIIVIPTGTSNDDVRSQVDFALELISEGIDRDRILFVVNGGRNQAALRRARSHLEIAGCHIANSGLRRFRAYEKAQNLGRAVSETPYADLNNWAEAVAVEIADFVARMSRERAFRKAQADPSINLRQAAASASISTPPGDLVDLNFKVDSEFRKAFKIRATRAGLTNRDFIRAAFKAYCEKYGD